MLYKIVSNSICTFYKVSGILFAVTESTVKLLAYVFPIFVLHLK